MDGREKRRNNRLTYIQSMLRELRTMAEAERCDMVAWFIEMAYVETSDILRGQRPLNASSEAAGARSKAA